MPQPALRIERGEIIPMPVKEEMKAASAKRGKGLASNEPKKGQLNAKRRRSPRKSR